MSERSNRLVKVEEQTCPRRMGELGPWKRGENLDAWERGRWAATQQEADAEVAEFMTAHPNGGIGHVLWNYGGEQPRTCSFCGGIHPDDAVALVRAGWGVDATGKWYKRYLEPPGYREWCNRRGYLTGEKPPHESPVPPVKVYVQHFNEAQIAAFNAALRQQHGPA